MHREAADSNLPALFVEADRPTAHATIEQAGLLGWLLLRVVGAQLPRAMIDPSGGLTSLVEREFGSSDVPAVIRGDSERASAASNCVALD
ncbi:MAG TPA: hypothetical protein VNU21_04125 [Usitatibacter sp.]|nr:hypothetical protein [Usitatibacter sp.]